MDNLIAQIQAPNQPWQTPLSLVVRSGNTVTHRGRRGVRLARREKGAYLTKYATDEQRSQSGCIGGRMPPYLRIEPLDYKDPKYQNTIQVGAAGVFSVQVTSPQLLGAFVQSNPGMDAGRISRMIADLIAPPLYGVLQQIPAHEHAGRRDQVAGQVLQRVNAQLAQYGLGLASLQIQAEQYGYEGFFKGFAKAAGPVLVLAGVLSIVLYFLGLNLRILVWIDAWGPVVGWGLRLGVIALGVVFFLLSRLGKK